MLRSGAGGRPRRVRGREKAQTGFDFLVGMSVFLVTIGLVLGFVPSMFQPFDTDTGPDMVTADRSAAHLVEDLLVQDVGDPGVLNATCTTEFFDADGAVGGCRFDDDAADVHAALALDEFTDVNVSIEDSGSVTSLDGVTLSVGDAPPPTADVVVAKRVVLLDGTHMDFLVRVW